VSTGVTIAELQLSSSEIF